MDQRDFKLLVALAQHQHFSSAAAECGISQPAISARLRKMEDEFGLPLVRRGNKFLGFTSEGQVVLEWAQKILNQMEGLRQEVEAMRADLTGKLVIGAVPTALPFAANASARLRQSHPNITFEIQSLSSTQIDSRLQDFSIDAGITYVESNTAIPALPLYDEHYVMIAPRTLAPRPEGEITWAECAEIPLCLLTQDMRNRQLVDAVFDQIEMHPHVVMETNGFSAALAQVASGSAATIAPQGVADALIADPETVQLSLVQPTVSHTIGLAIMEQNLALPMIKALQATMAGSS